jgi:beta-N-acetylglucosaminidase
MGRPKTEIDKKIFEGLCEIQCTKSEICNVLKCDEKTLTRWCKDTYNLSFSEAYKKESETGKMSLRRMQWESAEKGNTTMLVWLGKQYLGQTDKQELSGDSDKPVVVKFKE